MSTDKEVFGRGGVLILLFGRTGASYALRITGLLTLVFSLIACGGGGSGGPTPTPPGSFTVTVTPSGTGSGAVTGTGIDCGADCTESYAQGTDVMLTAVPEGSSTFAGWSGDCNGSEATCELTMDSAKSVTATFDQPSGATGKELSGTVEDWIGEAAIVKAWTVPFGGNSALLAEAPVSADGVFSVTLPGSEEVAEHLVSFETNTFCEQFAASSGDVVGSTIEMTPTALDMAEVYSPNIYTSADSDPIGYINYEGPSSDLGTNTHWDTFTVSQVYAASDATIKGDCTYTEGAVGTHTDTYDLNLKAGWNDVIYANTSSGGQRITNITTGNVPATATWRYYCECPF